MLAKKFRATRLNIEETMKRGSTVSGDFVFAKVSKISFDTPSFSIIVSKKIEKSSVGRHLIKRRISSVLEKNIKIMSPSFNRVILLFPKKIIPLPKSATFEKDIKNILEKTGFFV